MRQNVYIATHRKDGYRCEETKRLGVESATATNGLLEEARQESFRFCRTGDFEGGRGHGRQFTNYEELTVGGTIRWWLNYFSRGVNEDSRAWRISYLDNVIKVLRHGGVVG
jgi:hypothetical protein